MKWALLITAIALACGSLQAIETMDETMLENLHLEGLDAPAAGELRAPVAGDVSSANAKNLQKDLDDVSGITTDDTAVTSSGIPPPDLNDEVNTGNQNFNGRVAEVSVQKSASADLSSSQGTPYGAAINVNNTVNSVSIENVRRVPDSPINAGSVFLNNIQVNSQINIQQR